ncbi:hypothetical protein ABFP37_18535 [Burkholderia sp. RS01]|uniref:hypothetical protein n=1 Tax=unclassified Burkholderia TaxID=2613784 RepID=UPI003218639A
MTENIPPIPSAPQPDGFPSHAPTGAVPGNEPPQPYAPAQQPPYGPPQPYAPYAPQPQYVQPQYATYPPQQYGPPGQWSPYGPPKAKSSGFRVASGIIGIVLGTFLLIPAIAGFGDGSTVFMALSVLVAALGNITAGIVLLANQRGRSQGPIITSLTFAGLALLLGCIGMAVTYYGATLLVSTLLLASPVLIILGIGLSREKRGV